MSFYLVPPIENKTLELFETDPGHPSYYCPHCKGWVKGEAGFYQEDSFSILAGRRGTVESCMRCGNEIGFFGVQA
jgi:hypothetical protein